MVCLKSIEEEEINLAFLFYYITCYTILYYTAIILYYYTTICYYTNLYYTATL